MVFELPKLDYSYDSLEPFFDKETMEIHHTKHHQTYVDKLNAIVAENKDLQNKSLEELCKIPETKNMAGGHANHSFWWKQFSPNLKQEIPEQILKFKDEFDNKALKLFGSGWVWLIKDVDKFVVVETPNQDSPFEEHCTKILGIDLWEHAYYLKYQNRRAEYIQAFWNVIDWQKVLANV